MNNSKWRAASECKPFLAVFLCISYSILFVRKHMYHPPTDSRSSVCTMCPPNVPSHSAEARYVIPVTLRLDRQTLLACLSFSAMQQQRKETGRCGKEGRQIALELINNQPSQYDVTRGHTVKPVKWLAGQAFFYAL